MTLTDALLPDESNLYVNNIDMENGIMVISVSSTDPKGVCPHCQYALIAKQYLKGCIAVTKGNLLIFPLLNTMSI